ncbi:MAG: 30S ribosomal protein S14 [Rhodospirillaceae bacterium]|jgi:small subunit ribosomal protein S14|nr:30S ribosomal protein S14 [Rhodospirillaceae bacterium]
MAKISSIERNKKRENLVKQQANRRAELKTIIMNRNITLEDRFKATLKMAKLPRNSSTTRVRLRCTITGRPRGNYRKFKLCRIKLREFGSGGYIPGMIKSSW